jgi:hypothetical protein
LHQPLARLREVPFPVESLPLAKKNEIVWYPLPLLTYEALILAGLGPKAVPNTYLTPRLHVLFDYSHLKPWLLKLPANEGLL